MFRSLGEILILFQQVVRALPLAVRHSGKILTQFYEIGNASLLMACVLSMFIGGVLALQTGPVLANQGLSGSIGGLVGLSMCKELAPVMMAMLTAGRIGSAMAAEIGSMKVYQEIDALITMNINPVHYLVLPRMIAITLALPMLVVFAILAGWFGGALVSVGSSEIGISFAVYFNNLRELVDSGDVLNGIIKGAVFGIIIGTVSCHQGLKTTGGPRGIGHAVTRAVVNSLALILILDYFLTRILLFWD
ncbi:MAG TPA: ABC transporter permease [Verrucomicrobiales bacterium]|jgi:phospholipid/cholesterol/gamma-HCH transport system permease protein|nr:ABC transporter permease [Verrucomicrobiales bacterium]HIL70857.1 ABC transporter permease [Verrucomicrobiota bacterium]